MRTHLLHLPVYTTALAATVFTLNAQAPANFPALTVSTHIPSKVAEGYIFLASLSILPGASSFLMILDNDGRPVDLSWSPRGFARYHDLQIATGETFTSPEVDLSFQSDAFHVMSNVMSGATYHWRARSIVESSGIHVAGDWSTGSFQTAPPHIEIVAANGGELWQRGHRYFIQWNANIQENLSIDLHKDDVFLEVITPNTPGTGAYQWTPGFHLDPGADYSIKISSVSDTGLFAVSAAHFNIDVPGITTIAASGGSIVLGWEGTSAGVYVEHNPGFSPGAWTEIAGPIIGNSWTNTTPPVDPAGNYRLRLQPGKP
jgi:hypothetical protein